MAVYFARRSSLVILGLGPLDLCFLGLDFGGDLAGVVSAMVDVDVMNCSFE